MELCFCKSKVKVEVVWRLGQLRFIVQSPDYGPVGLGNSPGGLGRPRYTSWIETLKEETYRGKTIFFTITPIFKCNIDIRHKLSP